MSNRKIQRPWKLWMNQLAGVWKPVIWSSALLTFAGFLGDKGWLFDVAGIFRIQYAVAAFIGLLIFLAARQRKMIVVSLVVLLANLAAVSPTYLLSRTTAVIKSPGHQIRLLQINLNNLNRQSDAVLGEIRKLSPDLLCFEEVDSFWSDILSKNLPQYSFRKIFPQEDSFGIAVFSKLPLEPVNVIPLGAFKVPTLSTVVEVDNKSFRLLHVHVLPPRLPDYFQDRNREYAEIVELLAHEERPVVLAGDLNSPPWSFYFRKLCADGRLTDSENGRGVQPTWPTNCAFLLIPIDHLLTRGNITVRNRFVAGPIGSDHYPLCTDLVLEDK